MTFNQFMHPRNIYKANPPDFKKLALHYPEFRKHCDMDTFGKLHFDFKNPEAVLTLTKTLLEKDFGLFVDIPSDSLVPRIPGRLNYLLWLQDLMEENFKDEHIHCIDIGTGASCIYPLLGVKVCGWKFLAIESLLSNVDFARRNVERNSLQHVITVVHVAKDQSLYDVINSFEFPYFHFWMCNPPFFDTDEPEGSRSVIPRDPHSATVGKPEEMRTEGGEVRFVTRLIDESVKLNMKIRIYTSMLGRKISLRPVMDKLRSSGVASMCQTTFSQGKTQRWAVAWTFDKDVKLKDTSKTKAKRKDKKASYGFSVPEAALQPYTMNSFCEWLERLFSECAIKYVKVESSEALTRYAAEAMTNTWIGCRRKRRAAKQSLRHSDAKKPKIEEPVDGMHNEMACTSARSYCCDTPSSGKLQCPPVSSQCGTVGQSESPNKIAKEYSLPREEQDGLPILKFEVAAQASASNSLDVNFIFVFGQTPDLLHQLMQYTWNRLADSIPRTLSSHTSVCNDNPSCA